MPNLTINTEPHRGAVPAQERGPTPQTTGSRPTLQVSGPLSNLGGFKQADKPAFSYAHTGGNDMFELAASVNLPKIKKQTADPNARGAIPVIARDQKTFEELSAGRDSHIATLTKNQQKFDSLATDLQDHLGDLDKQQAAAEKKDPNHPGVQADLKQIGAGQKQGRQNMAYVNASSQRLQQQIDASRQTSIIPPERSPLAHLDPEHSKLYILGHGAAGSADLSTDDSDKTLFSLKDVAKGLDQAGLHKDFRSFRMPSCYSADAEPNSEFLDRPPGRTRNGEAPAQSFANELGNHGFNKAQVKGYQGAGVMAPTGPTAERFSADRSDIARRSEVGAVFTPESSVAAQMRRMMPKWR